MAIIFILLFIGGVIYVLKQAKIANDKDVLAQAENSEEARKQRAAWASGIKATALNVNSTCFRNKTANKPLVSSTYKTSAQFTEIMNELTKVAEKQGRIDSIAEELAKNGGASV